MISNFINLSSYCVLEFRATPIGDANPPLLTSQFYLVDNKHLGIKQIYNTDGYSATTRNTRNFSLIGLGGSKLIYNDITLLPMYSDFDPLITETTVSSELSINMVMDTMRFHFASGFNFTDVEHIIVGARHKLNNITQIQLANIILNSVTTASLFSYNTRPLFLANTIYDKYIDVKIPSIPWLDADFTQFGVNSFEHAITGGIGFIKNAPITVFLAEATQSNYFAPNNITYTQYQITQYYEGSVSQVNKFDTLGCYIEEAEDGDYIEFFATWNGAFPDSLIATLNEGGADQEWIISHQLTIYEHIGSDIVLSGNSLIYQETNFDTPLTYRPILKQAGFAVAMSIDYIMRLINKKNGDQVIKNASMSIINPNRYGKKLQKIELPNGPQSMRIYNKIEQKNFETNSIFTAAAPSISTSAPGTDDLTKTIADLTSDKIALQLSLKNAEITTTPFVKQENIKLSSGNVLSADGTQLIYGQGEGLLVVDPVDNLIIITIYSNSTNAGNSNLNAIAPLNLVQGFTGVIFKLTFGNTTDFIFSNITLGNTSNLANGQLLFRIPSIQAKLILENSEHNFMVTKVDPNLTETLMYTGTWLSSVDYQAATSAAAAATTAAINAASLAAANATITANNLLISQLTLEKTAATSALATHMQTHNTAGVGGTDNRTTLPPFTTIPPPTTTLPPQPVPSISRYTNATTNAAPVANMTNVKIGETIGLFTNVNNTTLTEIKLGNTLVTNYPPTDGSGFMSFTVPAGVGPGAVSITIKTAGGTASAATGPDYLTISEASSSITVNWRLYVGPLNQAGTAYTDWYYGNNIQYNDQFNIKTLNGAVETTHISIGAKASIDAYSGTLAGGYISGSFNYDLVNNQIKLQLNRAISNGANVANFNRNQIALDQEIIHYQNRVGSAGAYNPYFEAWVYDSNYTVSGGWMTFTQDQLFSQGQAKTLDVMSFI